MKYSDCIGRAGSATTSATRIAATVLDGIVYYYYRRLFCLPWFQAEFHVQPHALDPYRPTIVVEREICVVLQVERRKKAREHPRPIVTLPHIFRSVVQPPVSNQEVQAPARQIDGMNTGNPAGGERGGHRVVFPLPPRSFHRDPAAGQPVDGREGEVLGLAVIPAQPDEDPDIARDLLFQVHAGPVLKRSHMPHRVHVRRGSGLLT